MLTDRVHRQFTALTFCSSIYSFTANNIPPFCFATPHVNTVYVCLLFTRLAITSTVVRGCFHYEIDSQSSAAVFHGGCFQIRRKPMTSKKTPGMVLVITMTLLWCCMIRGLPLVMVKILTSILLL